MVITLVAWVVALFGATSLASDWRAARDDPRYRVRDSWPWGERAWLALRKNTVVGQATLTLIAVCLTFPGTAVWTGGTAFFVLPLVAISVGFFDRPRFLVPPPLR